MSILIKGMEMPASCFECKLLDYTDTYKCRVRFESLAKEHGINISRPNWCPLVPVPAHGRLIDADALKDVQQADADFFKGSSDYGDKCRRDEALNAVANIVNAPTIIEAEEGE